MVRFLYVQRAWLGSMYCAYEHGAAGVAVAAEHPVTVLEWCGWVITFGMSTPP